jgi:hypothetical protein
MRLMTTHSAPDEDDFIAFLSLRNLLNNLRPRVSLVSRMRGALYVLLGRAHAHTHEDRKTDKSIIDCGLRLTNFYRLAFYEARERLFELAPSKPWVPRLSLKATVPLNEGEITKAPRGFPAEATAKDVLNLVAELAGIDATAADPLESGAIVLWNETYTKLAKVEVTSVAREGVLICKVTVLFIVDDGVEIDITSDTFKVTPRGLSSFEQEVPSSTPDLSKLDAVKMDERTARKVYKELWEVAKEFRSNPAALYDAAIAHALLDTGTFSPFISIDDGAQTRTGA